MEYLEPQQDFKSVYKRNSELAYRGNPLHYTTPQEMDSELERLAQYNRVMQSVNPKLLKHFKLSQSDSANFQIIYEPRDYDYFAALAVPDMLKIRNLNPATEEDLSDSERKEAVLNSTKSKD